MMKKMLSLVLGALLFLACNEQEEMIRVDVDQAMNSTLSKKLSDVVKKLDYVALETDSNSLVGRNFEVALFDKDIAVIENRKILLFDRETGKFKQEVLHRGNEPGGYASALVGRGMVANEKAGYLFLNEWDKKMSTYNIYTKERKRFPVLGSIKSVAYTEDDSFVTTAFNFDGQHPLKMWVYNHYQCVDSIPNSWKFKLMSNAMTIIHNDEIFYRMNGRTYFKDATNDTVFVVTDTLTPAFVFKSSNLPQIELREHPDMLYQKMLDKYFVNNIVEDANHIYYTVAYQEKTYQLLYDKKTGESGVLKGGLTNDMDGGISLFPDHITDRGEYVFVLNPALMDEAELGQCNLKEDDNPMIVIGR